MCFHEAIIPEMTLARMVSRSWLDTRLVGYLTIGSFDIEVMVATGDCQAVLPPLMSSADVFFLGVSAKPRYLLSHYFVA